jgi:hypothetical protein
MKPFFAYLTISFILSFVLFLFIKSDAAGIDTIKTPKHFIKTGFQLNRYHRLESNIRPFSNNHPTYKYSFLQTNLSFYTPIYTSDKEDQNTLEHSNFHLLLTGNFQISKAVFTNFNKKPLFIKSAIGLRSIYNIRNKSLWFLDATPFLAFGNRTKGNRNTRIAATLIYSQIINNQLSFKIGIYKTYLFGNNRLLPIIGFRIGELNKTNFQFQFPRNASLNIPINSKGTFTLFIKSIGGVYNFRTISYKDSLITLPPTVLFGRFEALSGLSYSHSFSENFAFFAASGFSSRSWIGFSKLNKEHEIKNTPIRRYNLTPTLFINWGINIYFGNTKKIHQYQAIQEINQLNNSFDPGDNNLNNPAGNIPLKSNPQKLKFSSLDDLKDYITADDLY